MGELEPKPIDVDVRALASVSMPSPPVCVVIDELRAVCRAEGLTAVAALTEAEVEKKIGGGYHFSRVYLENLKSIIVGEQKEEALQILANLILSDLQRARGPAASYCGKAEASAQQNGGIVVVTITLPEVDLV